MDENVIFSDQFLMFWVVTEYFHHKISLSVVFSENYVQKYVFASISVSNGRQMTFKLWDSDKIRPNKGWVVYGWWKKSAKIVGNWVGGRFFREMQIF